MEALMRTRDYEHYKARFNNTKPIRGRAVEVRPIGERRRDWETITQKKLLSGETSYCAMLHKTECVEYFANGDITLRTNGWETPSTAEFIHEHSPLYCAKQYNRLWVKLKMSPSAEPVAYPIGNELQLRYVADGCYEPINKVLINKKVVDRQKAKEARAPVMPFLAWAKTFMAMSDGWLMHETRKEVLGWEEGKGYARAITTVFTVLKDGDMFPEDKYLPILFSVLCSRSDAVATRIAEVVTWNGMKYYDMQFYYEFLKKEMFKRADECADIHKVVQVEVGDKPIKGTVK
jgi:hypothetical protein